MSWTQQLQVLRLAYNPTEAGLMAAGRRLEIERRNPPQERYFGDGMRNI